MLLYEVNSSKHMQSNNTKLFIVAGVILALIVALLVWSAVDKKSEPGRLNYTYASELYGFSFVYPSSYTLVESLVEDPQSPRNAITLSDESGEQVKIEVFSNSLSQTPLNSWIRQSLASNFHLSSGATSPTTVAGVEGYKYDWEGGSATVLEHKGQIILISGVLGAEHYEGVVSSFKLE